MFNSKFIAGLLLIISLPAWASNAGGGIVSPTPMSAGGTGTAYEQSSQITAFLPVGNIFAINKPTVSASISLGTFLTEATQGYLLDPRNYGAQCNALPLVNTVSTTNNSNVVCASNYNFTTSDINKSISASYALVESTITGISGVCAIASNNATATTSNNYGLVGHDDTSAIYNTESYSGFFLAGQVMAIPNCGIANLGTVQGTSIVGTSIGYGQPIWYVFGSGANGSPNFGININGATGSGLRGFTLYGPAFPYNNSYTTPPYPGFGAGPVGVGGDGYHDPSGYWTAADNTSQAIPLENMHVDNFMVGYGRSPGHTGGYINTTIRSSAIQANGANYYGPFSDARWDDNEDEGGFAHNYYLGPALGAASSADNNVINNSHSEYNRRAVYCDGCIGLEIDSMNSDHNDFGDFYFTNNWGKISINGGLFGGGALAGTLTVTGTANNGSGLIRLTVANSYNSSPTNNLWTGDTATVSGIAGTTEANGTWTITVVDNTHVDLQSTTYTNAYSSGGIVNIRTKDAEFNFQGQGASGGNYKTSLVVNGAIIDCLGSGGCNQAFLLDNASGGWPTGAVISVRNGSIAKSYTQALSIGQMPANYEINTSDMPWIKTGQLPVSIGTNGYVGIGTTSTTNQLTVSGNVSIGTSYANSSAPTNGMIVQGNVGIGTATPAGTFTIQNASSHAGQSACVATGGAAGYCTSVVSSSGGCTCVAY